MNEQKIIRIGTRDSELAMWQANKVKNLLGKYGLESELIPVKSQGDLDLVTPLYAMGVEGVFTKTLDAYLLSEKIDIAVHSMKDVPVDLAEGLVAAAVLDRGPTEDIMVWKDKAYTDEELMNMDATIGTGSIRRKSQWLHKFPHHQTEDLRGNVQTRLRKLKESHWVGAIFAKAGLERMGLLPRNYQTLDWMLPAPAQGALLVTCRECNEPVHKVLNKLNRPSTAACVMHERQFLAGLHGGCSAPIGALCEVKGDSLVFKGNICNLDGTQMETIELTGNITDATLGKRAAYILLERGVGKIVEEIRDAAN